MPASAKAQAGSFLKDLDLARAIAEICGGSSPAILAIRVAASGPGAEKRLSVAKSREADMQATPLLRTAIAEAAA